MTDDEIKLHWWECHNPECRRLNVEIAAGPPELENEIGVPIVCLACGKPLKLVRVEML